MKNAKKRKLSPRGKPFSKHRQPPNENKRKKKRKTILKEKVGLDSWESIQDFLLTKGAGKFIKEMSKLKGRAYIASFADAIEFFKPKLSRIDHDFSKETVAIITGMEIISSQNNKSEKE
jgi:hypothetical protein